MERIFSALLPFCRPGPEGQLAAKALQKGSSAPPPQDCRQPEQCFPTCHMASCQKHAPHPPPARPDPAPLSLAAPSPSSFCSPVPSLTFSLASPWTHLCPRCPPPRPHPSPSLTSAPPFAASSPFCRSGQPEAHSHPQTPGLFPTPHLPPIPARALPLTLSPCPCPVLSLKQLLLPSEEDSGVGPPLEGDGVPGGGPPSPAQPQEIREELLSLEETIKQLEVVALGRGGEEGG